MTDEPEIIPPKPEAKPPGEFSNEIFDEICDRMANGKGLREICTDPEMPSRQTFLRWIEKDTGRQARYQHAREACMDWYGEEILRIAFDASGDIVKDGERTVVNNANVQRAKLQVDSYKWTMSKLHPKRYGDKLPETVEQRSHEAALLELENENPRSMTIGWQAIDRTIADPETNALKARIRELEEELGLREREKEPKLLTYNPGPLPATIDPVILGRVVSLIRDCVPQADIRPADEVLAEVESVCRKALADHYAVEAE